MNLEDRTLHTNTIKGYFSMFRRGMGSVYQHRAEKHLRLYLAEFDFRYNHRVGLGCSDAARTRATVRGAEGKRLTYRRPDGSGPTYKASRFIRGREKQPKSKRKLIIAGFGSLPPPRVSRGWERN